MPKPRRYLPVLLFIAAAAGCSLLVNPLTRLWFYTYGTGTPEGADSLLTPASFLELRPDGSYTRDFGSFEYGTWIRKGHYIILTDQGRRTDSLAFNMPAAGDMKITMRDGYVADFESRPIPAQKAKVDPFSLANNRWRLRPSHKETDREIRERLHDHCVFWETYFRWALDKGLSQVDVRSTPTPIKIYHNGFSLKPVEDLPAEWVSYFYDMDDCRKANEMIRNIFEHRTIAWANTDNPYKMFLSAFQQMSNYLK